MFHFAYLFILVLMWQPHSYTSDLGSANADNSPANQVIHTKLERINAKIDRSLHKCLELLYSSPTSCDKTTYEQELATAQKGLIKLNGLILSFPPVLQKPAGDALKDIIEKISVAQEVKASHHSGVYTNVDQFNELQKKQIDQETIETKATCNTILQVITMYGLFCRALGQDKKVLKELNKLETLKNSHSIGLANAGLTWDCIGNIEAFTQSLPAMCRTYNDLLEKNNISLSKESATLLQTIEDNNIKLKNLCSNYKKNSHDPNKVLWYQIIDTLGLTRRTIQELCNAEKSALLNNTNLKNAALLKSLDESMYNTFIPKLTTLKQTQPVFEETTVIAKLTELSDHYSPRTLFSALKSTTATMFFNTMGQGLKIFSAVINQGHHKKSEVCEYMQQNGPRNVIDANLRFPIQHKTWSKIYTALVTPLIKNSQNARTFLSWFDNKYCDEHLDIDAMRESLQKGIEPTKSLDLLHKMLGDGPFYRLVDIMVDLEKKFPDYSSIDTIADTFATHSTSFLDYCDTLVKNKQKSIEDIKARLHKKHILETTLFTINGAYFCADSLADIHFSTLNNYQHKENRESLVSPFSLLYYTFPHAGNWKIALEDYYKKISSSNTLATYVEPFITKEQQRYLKDFQDLQYGKKQREALTKMATLYKKQSPLINEVDLHKKECRLILLPLQFMHHLNSGLIKEKEQLINEKKKLSEVIIHKQYPIEVQPTLKEWAQKEDKNLCSHALDEKNRYVTQVFAEYTKDNQRRKEELRKIKHTLTYTKQSITKWDIFYSYLGLSHKHSAIADLTSKKLELKTYQNRFDSLYKQSIKDGELFKSTIENYNVLHHKLTSFTEAHHQLEKTLKAISY